MAEQCQEIIRNLFSSSRIDSSADESSLQKYIALEKQRPQNEMIRINCDLCKETGIEKKARGFLIGRTPMQIVICANRLKAVCSSSSSTDNTNTKFSKEIKEIVLHELVHANDFRNNTCDFSTCQGLAHSEIKAAREAECSSAGKRVSRYLSRELGQELRYKCIRSHAIRSTANIFGENAATNCVDDVFNVAVKDFSPIVNPKP